MVAASEVSLLYLQTNSIVTMCEKACPCHQKLIHKALQYLSRRIEDLQNNNNYITIKGMRLKIAQLIYDKYLEQNSLQLSLGMDRNEMAAFLNVSRPSMSREMMRMRDEGIMEFWKDKITIKNIQKLTAIVKGDKMESLRIEYRIEKDQEKISLLSFEVPPNVERMDIKYSYEGDKANSELPSSKCHRFRAS